jgi:hypothetical protein
VRARATEEEAPSLGLFGDALPAEPAPRELQANTLRMGDDNPIFRRVEQGSHTDLLVLSPAYDTKKKQEKTDIGAKEAREVSEFLSLTPAESEWRIVLIDSADQLNTHAANALLKILEEPPPRALLLLISHQPQGLLPTIRSRCRMVRVPTPSLSEFMSILETVAPHLASDAYAALYTLARGAAGLAITLEQFQAVKHYEMLMNALASGGEGTEASRIISHFSASKQPALWDIWMHLWAFAMQRMQTPWLPEYQEVFAGEQALWQQLHARYSLTTRLKWHQAARKLLADTEVFHLAKDHTLTLLLHPERLIKRLAA